MSYTKPKSSGSEGVIFLTNAFSPNMLSIHEAHIYMRRISPEEAKRLIEGKEVKSYIGHDATSRALSLLLGIPVETNRSMLKLTHGELIVFSLNARLQEGQTLQSIEEINKAGYTIWYVNVK